MTAAQRFNTLDGMRGVAAISVMICHFTQHTSRTIFSGAGVAVDIFFCLSGFVIAYSYTERLKSSMRLGEFVARRAIRLYPMFFIGLVLGGLALLAKIEENQTTLSADNAWLAMLLNTFYLPYVSDYYVNVGKDHMISAIFPANPPSWSLFFEFIVNVLFGAIALRARNIHIALITTAGVIGLSTWVMLTGEAVPGWGSGNIVGGIPRVFTGFFSGVLISMLFQAYKRRIAPVNPIYVIALLLAILSRGWPSQIWLLETVILVPFMVVAGSVATHSNRTLETIFDYLGWISYPVYCLHFPIYSLFTSITHNRDYGLFGVAICSTITLIASHFAAKKIEEPLRAMLSRRLIRDNDTNSNQ